MYSRTTRPVEALPVRSAASLLLGVLAVVALAGVACSPSAGSSEQDRPEAVGSPPPRRAGPPVGGARHAVGWH